MFSVIARVCLVFIAFTQILDVVSTNALLAHVPGAVEGNPLVGSIMMRLGDFWWLPKVGMAGFFLLLAVYLPSTVSRSIAMLTSGVAMIYLFVVMWNVGLFVACA